MNTSSLSVMYRLKITVFQIMGMRSGKEIAEKPLEEGEDEVEWRDPSASWLKLPLVLVKLVDYTDLRAYNQGFMLDNSLCIKHGDYERGRHWPSRF